MKKMKRILVALLSCAMAFACVAGFSGCEEPAAPAVSSSSEVADSSSSDSSSECSHTGGQATCTTQAICETCGVAYGELGAHTWVEHAETPASCTEDGTKAHFDCENCEAVSLDGETATEESLVIEATGHTWGDLIPAEEGNCVANGTLAHYACDCGALAVDGEEDEKVEVTADELVVAATGHKWVVDLGKPATCTEEGMPAHYVCTACDAQSLNGKAEACIIPLPALGHSWVVDLGKPATCTEEGIPSHYVCTVCEAQSLNGKAEVCIIPLPALGHSYGEWTITADPTEVLEGIAERECSCGDVDTVGLPALTDLRVWGPVPGVAPTCTEAGYKEYTSVYGNVRVEFPAFHDDSANLTYQEGLAPDCENAGYEEYYVCKICNEVVSGKEEIPANGHAWKAVEKVHENPCYATGTAAHYVCACGAVSLDGKTVAMAEELVVPVVGHKWVGVLPQAATCTIEGYVGHFVCTVCEAESLNMNTEICIKRETLKGEALIAYHKANNTYVLGENATCEEDGWIEHYTCAECKGTFNEDGEEIDVVIPANGHNYVNAYDWWYDLVMEGAARGEWTLAEAFELLDEVFPYGRNTDGYYCEFGPVCFDCLDMKTGIGHTVGEWGTEATCSEAAICGRCDKHFGEPDASKHVVDVPATCSTLAICGICSQEFGDYDKTVHAWTIERKSGAEADCFNHEMYKVVECGDCGQLAVYKPVSESEWDYVLISVEEFEQGDVYQNLGTRFAHVGGLTPATCTADATCSICGKSGADLKLDDADETNYVAHHVWGEIIEARPAACGINGVTVAHRVCAVCGLIDVDEDGNPDAVDVVIPAEEHDFVNNGGHPATCEEDAYCSKCEKSGKDLVAEGEDYSEFVAHHVWVLVDNKQPTCTENGAYKYWDCARCDELSNDGINDGGAIIPVPALGHEFLASNAVLGFAADCENEGRMLSYKCTRFDKCDCISIDGEHVYEGSLVIPALGHNCVDEGYVAYKAADCTNNGNIAHWDCTRCDALVVADENGYKVVVTPAEVVIPADAAAFHADKDNLTFVPEKAYTCTESGHSAYYVCPVCAAEFERTNSIPAHRFTVEVKAVAPTCKDAGNIAYFECTGCDAISVDGITEFTGDVVVPATGLHTCADISRYCGHMVPCDGCGTIFDCPNPNPAPHVWDIQNGETKCKYCHIVFDFNNYVYGEDYLISGVDSFLKLAELVNVEGKSFYGVNVILLADVDLAGIEWAPIGTKAHPFAGKFDGRNFTVSNLTINAPAKSYVGLFGDLYAQGHVAKIINLTVANANVTGFSKVGVIAGRAFGTISNCHVVDSTVVCVDEAGNDGDKAGAIVGYLAEQEVMSFCSATNVTITANRDAGQLVGCKNAPGKIIECTVTNVTVSHSGFGSGANIKNELVGRIA